MPCSEKVVLNCMVSHMWDSNTIRYQTMIKLKFPISATIMTLFQTISQWCKKIIKTRSQERIKGGGLGWQQPPPPDFFRTFLVHIFRPSRENSPPMSWVLFEVENCPPPPGREFCSHFFNAPFAPPPPPRVLYPSFARISKKCMFFTSYANKDWQCENVKKKFKSLTSSNFADTEMNSR